MAFHPEQVVSVAGQLAQSVVRFERGFAGRHSREGMVGADRFRGRAVRGIPAVV